MSQWDFNYIMELVLHLFFIFQKILWLLLYPLPLIEQQTWWQLRDDTEAPFFLSHILSSFSPASFWGKGFLSVPVLIPAGVWLRRLRGNRHGELLAPGAQRTGDGRIVWAQKGLRSPLQYLVSAYSWFFTIVIPAPPLGYGIGYFFNGHATGNSCIRYSPIIEMGTKLLLKCEFPRSFVSTFSLPSGLEPLTVLEAFGGG